MISVPFRVRLWEVSWLARRRRRMGSAQDAALVGELQSLQKQLGKKASFEDAVLKITDFVRERYSPALHTAIYSAVCRVATVLQTRYTTPGFWLAGLRLFEEAERLATEASEREHLNKCISRAREHLHDSDIPSTIPETAQSNRRYLFEGHLTVDQEPPPPNWLVAQNVLTALAASQDWNNGAESSNGQATNDSPSEINGSQIPDNLQEFVTSVLGLANLDDIDSVIEASLQEIGAGPKKAPPASKKVVANLPVIHLTAEMIERLGKETECAVCRENLVINDKMQELPCSHLFHPECLKPWLDENNSCPTCRHELQTDDHVYESWKEREKEAEEERKGAANALRGGEYMYV